MGNELARAFVSIWLSSCVVHGAPCGFPWLGSSGSKKHLSQSILVCPVLLQ
jgi:hypothetical protein